MGSNLSTASKVPVNLGKRSYDIVIGPGAIDEVASTITSTVQTSHLVVVSDSNVAPIYLEKICLLYTSPSPRDQRGSRMPSSA